MLVMSHFSDYFHYVAISLIPSLYIMRITHMCHTSHSKSKIKPSKIIEPQRELNLSKFQLLIEIQDYI